MEWSIRRVKKRTSYSLGAWTIDITNVTTRNREQGSLTQFRDSQCYEVEIELVQEPGLDLINDSKLFQRLVEEWMFLTALLAELCRVKGAVSL